MEEQLVELEVAKLAKEKGFNEICYHHFGCDEESFGGRGKIGSRNSQWINCCTRPTQGLLQRWLREIHNIHVNVSPLHLTSGWRQQAYSMEEGHYNGASAGFHYKTFEKALEEGLLQGLKLIKQ
jgi:hypothetical protein